MKVSVENGLLRDLSEAEFTRCYSVDRFTTALLTNRLQYVVRHMCSNLLFNAFSPILRDTFDFAATVAGPAELDYAMAAVSNSLALFTGSMADATRNVVVEYGLENLRPGDVLMVNDPYRAGNHVNDLSIIRPVFVGGRVVSFLAMRAHQIDMGGITPGGFSGLKRSVYESGLVIPPTLLYREDKPVKSAFNLILDNARFGALLLPDLKSLYQGLRMGERLLIEMFERYGSDACFGAMRYACDLSAEGLASGLERRVPDGVYEGEDMLDADGVDDSRSYRIKLKIRKVGREIEIDFSGTSAQARTSINCGPLDVKSAVAVALKMLVDWESPFTSGTFRHIDIVLPAGTLLSATPPDGAIFLYWEASMPVAGAILRALANALGENAIGGDYGSPILHNANGVHADGRHWVAVGQGGTFGPWGGTRHGDGDSCQVNRVMNLIDTAVETAERDSPVVLLRRDYVPDSAGAGQHRGGAANLTDVLWLEDGEHISMPLHVKAPTSFGANRGKVGTSCGCWLYPPDRFDITAEKALPSVAAEGYKTAIPVGGVINEQSHLVDPHGTYVYFGGQRSRHVGRNSIYRYLTAGAGGWGDPLSRDPERVRDDVRDEYVTIEGALRDYGVVIVGDPHAEPEHLRIDLEATRAERITRTRAA